MPRYFLDSSALVKRYHQENGSDAVDQFFNEPANRLLISRLALVELHSAFVRLVREAVITEADFDKLIARLDGDVASGALTVAAVSSRRLEAAATILRAHGLKNNIRTLDAIHLATAQVLDGRSRLAAFIASDKKLLASAATALGLTVLDVSQ